MTDTHEDSVAGKLAREIAEATNHAYDNPRFHVPVLGILARFIEERDREKDAEWSGWGTIEVAIRNPNVSSFMDHWTTRAEKAEAECAKLREERKEWKGMLNDELWEQLDAARTALAEARGLLDSIAHDAFGAIQILLAGGYLSSAAWLGSVRGRALALVAKIDAEPDLHDRTMAGGEQGERHAFVRDTHDANTCVVRLAWPPPTRGFYYCGKPASDHVHLTQEALEQFPILKGMSVHEQRAEPPADPLLWRVGRKVGRTIYRGDTLIGVMDTRELAAQVVAAVTAVYGVGGEAEPPAPVGQCSNPNHIGKIHLPTDGCVNFKAAPPAPVADDPRTTLYFMHGAEVVGKTVNLEPPAPVAEPECWFSRDECLTHDSDRVGIGPYCNKAAKFAPAPAAPDPVKPKEEGRE